MITTQMNERLPAEMAPSTVTTARDNLNRGSIRQGTTGNFSKKLRPQSIRVLVVDDEEDSADDLAWWLHSCGHDSRVTYDEQTALQLAAKWKPQLILHNLEIRDVDGCHVARQMRSTLPRNECFIIAFTWRTDEERRSDSIKAGVDLLLVRPVDPMIVETLLLLEMARAERLLAENTVRRIGSDDVTPRQ